MNEELIFFSIVLLIIQHIYYRQFFASLMQLWIFPLDTV